MNALKDESVRFRAGWNAARDGRTLTDSPSDETYAGYEAYFLQYSPPIPRMKTSEGYNSQVAKDKRRAMSEAIYLNNMAKNGIK